MDEVILKIRRLLALANDKRGNPFECEVAEDLANRLMQKHNIKKEQIDSIISSYNDDIDEEELLRQMWVDAIIRNPKSAENCTIWEKFSTWDWAYILEKRPEFAKKCNKWEEFDNSQWRFLLISQPQFANKCHAWHTFTDRDWTRLLRAHPELKKYLSHAKFEIQTTMDK